MDDMAIYAPEPTVDEVLADDWVEQEFQKLELEVNRRHCPHSERTEITTMNDTAQQWRCNQCGRVIVYVVMS